MTEKKTYDLIIIGAGGIGSAALYSAINNGLTTLCLEQYERGHTKGGSHGETRAFRKAYYENQNYIPILKKAYIDWKNLDTNSTQPLFVENGILEIATPNSKMVLDAIACLSKYKIPLDILSAEQIKTRFPGFYIPEGMVGIFQPEGGYLCVDKCINNFVDTAINYGASVNYREKVLSWHVDATNLVQVNTDKTSYQSKYLIISTGSWTSELLDALNIPLSIIQKKLVWVPVDKDEYSIQKGSPCFAYHLNNEVYYGFPNIEGFIKVARHNGGMPINHPNENFDYLNNQSDEAQDIRTFVANYLTKNSLNTTKQANCLYDVTPDKQFIIDNHPDFPQVAFAAGLSGHAYKMSNVLGDILVNLVMKQSTDFNISFLSLKRF